MNDPAGENVVPFNGGPKREPTGSALQIIGRCRNLAASFLERYVREMLDNTDDALFKLAEQAEDNVTQSEYFDAMREVRRKRSTIESEYPTQLARLFDSFLHARPKVGSRPPEAMDLELSLVGNEELEENLALEGMISKATRVNEAEIYALTRRLAVALDRPRLAEDAHPLTPAAICDAFRESMTVLDVDLRVRLIIYKLFDKYVISQLARLYDEVNQSLVDRGILPELRGRAGKGTHGAASHGGLRHAQDGAGVWADASDDDSGEGNELLSLLRQLTGGGGGGGFAGGAAVSAGGVTFVEPSRIVTALRNVPAGSGPTSGKVYSSAELKDVVLTAVRGDSATGAALNHVDETAIDIVAMLFDFIFEDPALPGPIKELIGRLQIPVLRVAIIDKTFFGRKKHPARRLLNELTRAGIGWTAAEEREDGLRTRIESVVERLSNDFEDDPAIFEEELLSFREWCDDQAQRAAQREEHSALAAQGREHLRVAKAVAQESINRVVEDQDLPDPIVKLLKSTWQDLLVLIYLKDGQHGKLWQKALNVASLLVWSLMPKPSQTEREQLTEMLPSLLKAIQEGMTRMSCSEEEQQSVLAVLAGEHARLVRDTGISADVDETTVIGSGGAPDGSGDVVADASETGDEEVEPSDVPMDDGQKQGSGTPLRARPMSGAPEAAAPSDLHDGRSFMARKVAEINQRISDGSFRIYDDTTVRNADAATEDDLHVRKARELEEGTWLELPDADGNPLRAKLSWKSLISGKYFFVNRQGLKVKELTVPDLAGEFRAGRAWVIEDVPVFDRAISTLMTSLSSSAN